MSLPSNSWFSPICSSADIAIEEYQSGPNRTRRSRRLVELLRSCRDAHSKAAPSILATLDELIRQVENEKIAIADSKEKTVFYGQRYLLSSMAELFDPVLANLMPPGSLAHNLANAIDGLFPLSRSLRNRENCKYVADSLEALSKRIKNFSNYKPEQEKILRESIHCIMETVDAVRNVLPIETLNWCQYCFRRTAIHSNFCNVHMPSNDTEYRTGKRIYSTLSKEVLDHRARYQTARRAIRESVNLVSRTEDIIPAMSKGPSITVPEQVAQLTEQTISNWALASTVWTKVIEYNFPSLSKIIVADMPCAHSSWKSWTTAIRKACCDESEHTTHPYWILNILACAEDWFAAENIAKDQRKTDTENQIQTLWEAGTKNASEIARQLNVSRQYVARVIRRLKLRE